MVTIIQSPNENYLNKTKISKELMTYNSLFLAGGISNCPNWQNEFINKIQNKDLSLLIFNPRQIGDLSKTNNGAITQIKWENKYLEACFNYVFWFPKEGLCQISLFELGKYSQRIKYEKFNHKSRLFIGVEPGYIRQLDVETQMSLMFNDIEISYSLDELINRVITNFSTN